MSGRPRPFEWIVLGGCAFVLTQAILSLVLGPGDTPTEGNAAWELILAVGYLSVVAILVPFYRETLYVLRRNWSLVALVLLALVSCSWAAMPAFVLRRSVAVLGTTLLGLAFAVRLSLEDQLRLLSWLFRIIAVLSLACIVFLPSYGISDLVDSQGAWQGIFSHKNGLGSFMALFFLVEWQLPASTRLAKVRRVFALLLSAVLLLFSRSLTPALALAGTLLFTQTYKFATQKLRIPLYALALAVFVAAVSGATVLVTHNESIATVLGRSSDLTGRTSIWSLVIPSIFERPVRGYGFSGFWAGASPESAAIERAMGTIIQYSHNGYLEILLELGAVGFFVTLVFLGTGVRRAIYRSKLGRSSVDLWPFSFMVYFLLHNFGECTILYQDLEWAICVATVIGTDPALCAADLEQEDALPLTLAEEFK
jgi:exopolysaccharide production protein ExoQ